MFSVRGNHVTAFVQKEERHPGCAACDGEPWLAETGINHNAGDEKYRPVNIDVYSVDANDAREPVKPYWIGKLDYRRHGRRNSKPFFFFSIHDECSALAACWLTRKK